MMTDLCCRFGVAARRAGRPAIEREPRRRKSRQSSIVGSRKVGVSSVAAAAPAATLLTPTLRDPTMLDCRDFLRLGSLSIAGLPALRAATPNRQHKSVIMVYLTGGLA